MKNAYILVLAVVGILVLIGGTTTLFWKDNNATVAGNNTVNIQEPADNKTVDIYAPNYRIKDEVLDNLTKYVPQPAIADGTLYTATGLKGENIKIVISALAIHNTGPQTAWTTLLYANKIHEGNQAASFTDTRLLDVQNYNTFYMYLSKVTVTVDGKEYNAILPKDKFYIEGEFVKLNSNNKTYLELDFINDNTTLFKTVDGQYIYSPKINILAYRNATTDLYNHSFVNLTSGVLWTNMTVGMNLDGEVMSGYKIDPTKEIAYKDGKLSYVESNHLLNATSL